MPLAFARGPPRCGPRHPERRDRRRSRSSRTSHAVGTVGRRDGHDFGHTRGRDVTRVGVGVPCGRHVCDPGLDRPAYGGIESFRRPPTSRSPSRPGWIAFAVTQSIPASNCETVPVPAQSSTRIDTSDTAGALPLSRRRSRRRRRFRVEHSLHRSRAWRPRRHPVMRDPGTQAARGRRCRRADRRDTGAGCAGPIRIVERQVSLVDTVESPRNRVHGRRGADPSVLLHRVDERTPAERERALGRRTDREPGRSRANTRRGRCRPRRAPGSNAATRRPQQIHRRRTSRRTGRRQDRQWAALNGPQRQRMAGERSTHRRTEMR